MTVRMKKSVVNLNGLSEREERKTLSFGEDACVA